MTISDRDIARRMATATALARECAALALEHRRDPARMNVQAKGRRDFVTAADLAVERLIRERISREFPGDGFLGEEGGGASAPLLWVVDPIDGTNNFARGLPSFAVSIAFCVDGRPVVGAIAEPVTGAIYTARKGGGSFRDEAPIRVSDVGALDQAMIEYGYAERRPVADNLDLARRLLDAGCDVRQVGSAALGLARVAEGCLDAYCELHLNSWDVLAGMLLVEEAGGRFSDFLAGDGMTRGNSVLAATPGLVDDLKRVTGL
ncbi:MAG: inositol monophosphatase [Alphaproteobacteria bacterium]|nr:inositol monophosphatase [Alphaproteobacteria bacterium]